MPSKTSIAALVIGLMLGKAACAQAPMQSQTPVPPPQPATQVVMPDAQKIVLLLRTTLLTLNDAVETGNFTVLRDKGAPGFRDANSPARLSAAFSDLASKHIDLSAVAVITPQLTETPGLDQEKRLLHLKGYFPGQPVQIDFELLYQAVNGQWRLFGLSVQPASPASSAPAAADRPKSASSSVPKKQ